MGSDFFDRLDADLAALTRQGAHLTAGDPLSRRVGQLARRGVAVALVAVTMAAALVGEFPASASGHAQVAQALSAHRL